MESDERTPHEARESARNVTVEELGAKYITGERKFTDLEIDDASNFSGKTWEGAIFDGTWLCDAIFRGCNLRGASFRGCNLKCSDFRDADLRGAVFDAALEASDFTGALMEGARFVGSSVYGYIMKDGELPPH